MRFRRWWVLPAMIFLLCAGRAGALEQPEYTAFPELWRDLQAKRAEADWLLKAYVDPPSAFQETEQVKLYLDIEEYQIERMRQRAEREMRNMIRDELVAEAQWDPVFVAVLEIARENFDERELAINATDLLLRAVRQYVDEYPAVAEPAAEIFFDRLSDGREGVVFVAARGVGVAYAGTGSDEAAGKLTPLLGFESEAIVGAAEESLARIGSKSAVGPLMEALQSLSDQTQVARDSGETSSPTINQGKLAVAEAVEQLTDADLPPLPQPFTLAQLQEKYQQLIDWWEQNKDRYS